MEKIKKTDKLCLFAAREKPFRVRPTLQRYNDFLFSQYF